MKRNGYNQLVKTLHVTISYIYNNLNKKINFKLKSKS